MVVVDGKWGIGLPRSPTRPGADGGSCRRPDRPSCFWAGQAQFGEEQMSGRDQGDVTLPAGEGAAFEVGEAESDLQLAVVMLDPPADLGQPYQVPQPDVGRQSGQPVVGGLALAGRPFGQQPALGQLGVNPDKQSSALLLSREQARLAGAPPRRVTQLDVGATDAAVAVEDFEADSPPPRRPGSCTALHASRPSERHLQISVDATCTVRVVPGRLQIWRRHAAKTHRPERMPTMPAPVLTARS